MHVHLCVCSRLHLLLCVCAVISGLHATIFQVEAKVNSMIISTLVAVRKEFETYNWGEMFSNNNEENVALDQIRLSAHDSLVCCAKCESRSGLAAGWMSLQ